jgi:hypothetical protein
VVDRAVRLKGEDELAWTAVKGIIETYDRKNIVDVLVEGLAATPERLHQLKLKNLRLKAIFVGYSKPSHAAAILNYTRAKRDWVSVWLKEQGGDISLLDKWVAKGIRKNKKLKRSAEKFGYRYFDLSTWPFKEHLKIATNYFMRD